MIGRLVLFGATGDLAGRFLFPALARASAAGELAGDLAVVGAAPEEWDDERFAAHVTRRLEAHAGAVSGEVRAALIGRLRYRRVDLADADTVTRAVHGFDEDSPTAVAVYLALPPTLFPAAVEALATANLPAGSRIAVEKPFGANLAGAVALNAQLAQVSGGASDAVFRVDHALAMPGVQDLAARRAAALDSGNWDSRSLEQVDVLWEETIGLEGRADFFDRTGAVRDVMQNHLLQILALVAMEPPPTTSASDLHRAKLDVLRSIGPKSAPAPSKTARSNTVPSSTAPANTARSPGLHIAGEVAAPTARARYSAGTLADGRAVPDYADEPGVDPDRSTETWAELRLEIDQPRWAGTTFVLRAGKALAADRKGVMLHLRAGTHSEPETPEPNSADTAAGPRWIGLESAADPPTVPGETVAYGQVLIDLLSGGSLLSVSAEEAEATWRIIEPVLDAWAAGAAPLAHYPAGGSGRTAVAPPPVGGP